MTNLIEPTYCNECGQTKDRHDDGRCPDESPFGPVISSYSRAQAIADGVLVDVSDAAREAGFKYPVAVTAAVWAAIADIPASQSHQDVNGRLWDVLWMGRLSAAAERGDYRLIMHNSNRTYYYVKMTCGPGDTAEPVITLMEQDES